MSIRLTGSAGTGDIILENWDMFEYELDKDAYDTNCKENVSSIYPFNVQFGNQSGYMTVAIENNEISQSTVIDCGFDRPLGAYNDTVGFNQGLYKVAEKMLKKHKLKPYDEK